LAKEARIIVLTIRKLLIISVILTALTMLTIKAIDTLIPSGYGFELIPLFLLAFSLIAWLLVVGYWLQKMLGNIR